MRHMPCLVTWIMLVLDVIVGHAYLTMGTTKSYMEINPRIVSGRPTAIHFHRHLVVVICERLIFEDGRRKLASRTGHGTLLTLKWVITAAHIVEQTHPSGIYVYAGVSTRSDLDSGAAVQVQAVCERIIHPLYTTTPYGHGVNDMAMLRLRGAFHNSIRVRPIGENSIPEYSGNEFDIFRMFRNRRCVVAGFGLVGEGVRADELQETSLKLVDSNTCYNLGFIDEPTHWSVCAFNNDSTTYKGDSGTPLICEGCFIGVLVYGVFNLSEPKSNRINVFARTDFWKGWILDVMWAYHFV